MLIRLYIKIKEFLYRKWIHGILPKWVRLFLENALFSYTWLFHNTFQKGNIRYYINDTHDYMEKALFMWDHHDHIDFIMSKIQDDMVILDIGANIGDTAMQFAEKIWKWGFIYWFEPDTTSYRRALKNFSLNSFNNIEIENIGLWNIKGELLINNNPSNRWSNFISKTGTERIHIDTLDNWVKWKAINRVNLIKIDVEWYEYRVLIGGINTLKKYKPDIFLELDDSYLKRNKDSGKKVIKLLNRLGYTCIDVQNGKKINLDQNLKNIHTDIYAFLKEKATNL